MRGEGAAALCLEGAGGAPGARMWKHKARAVRGEPPFLLSTGYQAQGPTQSQS